MGALVILPGRFERRATSAREHRGQGRTAPSWEQAVPERHDRQEAEGSASRPGEARLRLTPRGRLVVVALALVLGALLGFIGGRAHAAAIPSESETLSVAVMPGDSLWSLAQEVAQPRQDIRDVVLEIKRVNGLGSSSLRAGDVIKLPVP